MARYKYSVKEFNEENMAKAVGTSLGISTKASIEICNWIRKRGLTSAKKMMADVIAKKRAVPYKRFTGDVGHKTTTSGSGRYPIKACQAILKLLNSVEANAQFKGMNTSSLVIDHICAQKASAQMRHGRQRGREAKSTHVEIVVKEGSEKKKTSKPTKKEKQSNKSTEKNKDKNKTQEDKK